MQIGSDVGGLLSGAGSTLVWLVPFGLAGGVAGVVSAWIQRGGAQRVAEIARQSAAAVAEINRDAQRLFAVDASRRDWRKELFSPLLTLCKERIQLSQEIDRRYQTGDVSAAQEYARNLLATDFSLLLDSIRRISPIPVHNLLMDVAGIESIGRTFAYAALDGSLPRVDPGPLGPDDIPVSERYRHALALLYEAHDLFVYEREPVETTSELRRRMMSLAQNQPSAKRSRLPAFLRRRLPGGHS